jgi:acetolactate synthase-1/2/3 large subunit
MIGADAVVSALNKLGVTHVFGIVSIHNMPIFDAINRDGRIQIIDCRHEMAATHAADGYARATGRIGVAVASTGPGTTNTVTGLYEAEFSSSPVMLITGQVETRFYGKAQGYVHEAEQQLPMLRTVTRTAESVRVASQIEATILNVANAMTSGRPSSGAVEIPIDLQYQEVQPSESQYTPQTAAVTGDIATAVELIAASRKRIIIAGGGINTAGAAEALTRFAEKLKAPVFTTTNGRGAIPDDHELTVGNLWASRKLQADIADADLTIAIGTRFQAGVGGTAAHLTPPGKLLHIDVDASIIDRVHKADASLVGDAALTIPLLEAAMNPEPADEDFVQRVQGSNQALRQVLTERIGPDYQGIMECVREHLPRDGLIVRDTTQAAYHFTNQLMPVFEPRTFIGPASAAIGPGLPLAVGAAAGTGRRTVVVHGDGGFMLHATELATIAQYSLPMVILVFNDGGYGVLRGLQSQAFDGRYEDTDLGFVDYAKMAESMGVQGVNVTSLAAFQSACKTAMAADQPVLIDIDMRQLEPMKGTMLPGD